MQENKIFVGNLPFNINEEELRYEFEKFGDIEKIDIPKDRKTHKSRGFAFITYTSQDSAQKALKADESKVGGRNIKVNIAQNRKI